MYEIPSQQDVSKVVIDESVIDGSSQPLMIYENSESQPRLRLRHERAGAFGPFLSDWHACFPGPNPILG